MKRSLLILIATGMLAAANAQAPARLTCEHRTDPLGIDAARPRLSWKMTGTARNLKQAAYEIQVATAADFTAKATVWNTGKVDSDESVLREYAGRPLVSGQRYHWRVRTWSGGGEPSGWSGPAFWETGLLAASDWKARWIDPEKNVDTARSNPVSLLRKEFALRKPVASARAYVTAYGLYELYLNGRRVGTDLLTPGWTSYNRRLQYQVYDVTDLLATGRNAVGAQLADGWYRGELAWSGRRNFYGKRLALLCQIEVRYQDGTRELIRTDETWKTSQNGPVRMAEIYHGETYDARLERTGWTRPGYDDKAWPKAAVADRPYANLTATAGQPVRRIQEIKPVRIFRTPQGTLVADMGQNLVGWVRLNVSGAAGTKVTLRHTEVLDKAGNFYTAHLRHAKQRIEYTLKGGGEETYEPHFTFMGFRYVAVEGFPGEPKPENLTAVVVHSDMPPIGGFECSNPLVNKLQQNIQWGQKGNFVDVPTDCPQRDERLGWTGDAQVFCRTAAFNMDVAAFFTKWMRDVAADQGQDGAVPFVIPDVLSGRIDNLVGKRSVSAGWGDVAVIAPWTLYQVYGDRRMLETQYPSMKGYVDYIRSKAGDSHTWRGGSVFGDWLFYRPAMYSFTEPDGYTNNDFIATAFYAYSTQLLAQTAQVLGRKDDARTYNDLAGKIKETFIREYVTPAGRIASDSQTAYVLALMFDLLPADLRPKAAAHLAADIRSRKNHLSTGFLGTPYLCHVLSGNGYTDVAYDLLLQESYPSWLYPVKMGATTIWERWDGIKPDSTFQDTGMNSFNHYAYGAVGDWMYRVAAGIETGGPGYKHILIQPQLPPAGRLTHAKAYVDSPYGKIASGWAHDTTAGQFTLSVTVPPNTTATLRLPQADPAAVREGGQPVAGIKADGPAAVVEVGSGEYVFVYPLRKP